jgi:DNA-binding response OmpR family regulator
MARKVLVVEDEPNIVESLCFLVRKAGYEVLVARDGQAAIRTLESHHPELILLDVMLPRLDGYEVCRAVRGDPRWKDIHIIMLTAKGRDLDRRKGLDLGADDYITKPFSTREIVERVREVMDARSVPEA